MRGKSCPEQYFHYITTRQFGVVDFRVTHEYRYGAERLDIIINENLGFKHIKRILERLRDTTLHGKLWGLKPVNHMCPLRFETANVI